MDISTVKAEATIRTGLQYTPPPPLSSSPLALKPWHIMQSHCCTMNVVLTVQCVKHIMGTTRRHYCLRALRVMSINLIQSLASCHNGGRTFAHTCMCLCAYMRVCMHMCVYMCVMLVLSFLNILSERINNRWEKPRANLFTKKTTIKYLLLKFVIF